MKTQTAKHSGVDPHTIDLLFFVFPCNKQVVKAYEYQLNKRCLERRLEGFKDSSWFLKIMKLVEYRIAKKWVLESGIQLKESEIPFTIGIRNPNSTHKVRNPVPAIRNRQLGIQKPRLSWILLHGTKN